ncbi:MAG: hypothetical protein LC737_00620 [Chloroflexi bacterium]|nr:hypothetical protein [Chloroflexota bacterium]
MKIPNPNLSTADVLDALRASGKPLREWGKAIDGTPLFAARTGGNKQPAIFITTGSHAPETAGVHAALNLLRMLETEHETHVLPLRDPLGFGGVNHALSFATGERVAAPDYTGALEFLCEYGKLLWSEDTLQMFMLGALGFVWDTPQPGAERMMSMAARLVTLSRDDPAVLKPLWGKRVMAMCASVGVEGTGEMRRCWHGVFSESGEWMHLNRFFGRADAPAEVAAVDQLMQTIRPGLTCDLHEGNGAGFWMPMRKQSNPELVFNMTQAYLAYINAQGYPITTYDDWIATDRNIGKNYAPTWMQPEPRLPGLFWADGTQRNEGYNLIDYSCLFGIGYGTEAPLARPLAERVDGITNGILRAIKVWERNVVTT